MYRVTYSYICNEVFTEFIKGDAFTAPQDVRWGRSGGTAVDDETLPTVCLHTDVRRWLRLPRRWHQDSQCGRRCRPPNGILHFAHVLAGVAQRHRFDLQYPIHV